MNLELTPEQLALRESVRRRLKTAAEQDFPVREPGSYRDRLTGLDLGGLLIPENHGGSAACMVDAGVVLEEIGRALDPGPWPSTSVAVPRVIARAGVIDRAADLLRAIADNAVVATIGLADAHEPSVRATRHNDSTDDGNTGARKSAARIPNPSGTRTADDPSGLGNPSPPTDLGRNPETDSPAGTLPYAPRRADTITLDGLIAEIPDADLAQVLLVIAHDGTGPGLFAIEIPTAGVEFESLPVVDRSRPQFRATLRDVPARHLGTISHESLSAAIDDILIATASEALGAAQALFDLAVDYARTRRQFDRPIGSFQAVQHLCVDMYETIELTRSGVIHGLWAADSAAHADRHLAALRLKAFSGRLATMGEIAIQVFGGIGYTWEHPAHRYLERLLSWSAHLGSPDHYLREIGGELANKIEATRTYHRPPAR